MPLAELFLGKQRILEIYLNVVEWGPGFTVRTRPVMPTTEPQPEYRPATGGTARRDFTGSLEAPPRAHESVQRGHPGANETNGLVTDKVWATVGKRDRSRIGPLMFGTIDPTPCRRETGAVRRFANAVRSALE